MKTTKCILCFAICALLTAPLFALGASADTSIGEAEAIECARESLFYHWLLDGYYDDFCRTDEEWANDLKSYPNAETCDLYRNWLLEKGYATKERAQHKVFEIKDASGAVTRTLDLHAFPEGVTAEAIRADQTKYAPAYMRYYTCSNEHAANEPCFNRHLYQADGRLYGSSTYYNKDAADTVLQGPFTYDAAHPTVEFKNGSANVLFPRKSYAPGVCRVEMIDGKACTTRVLYANDSLFGACEHLPYKDNYAEALDAAAKGAYLICRSYWGFEDQVLTTDPGALTAAEARLYEFFKNLGLTVDCGSPYSDTLPADADADLIGSALHVYPFCGIGSAKEFRAAVERYLAKDYVDQILEKGFVFEDGGALWSRRADAGTLLEFSFDCMRVKAFSDDRAVISIGNVYEEATLILQKTDEGWKTVGGDFAGEFFLTEPAVPSAPETGEYTALCVLLLLASFAALAALCAVGVRKELRRRRPAR